MHVGKGVLGRRYSARPSGRATEARRPVYPPCRRRNMPKSGKWFLDRDGEDWGRQIERGSAAGKLDFLAAEAPEAKKSGTPRDL